MVWRPAKTLGIIVGLIILVTIIGVDTFLFRSLLHQVFGLNLFLTALLFILSLPLLFVWTYWYIGFLTLRYYLDRNALVISCSNGRQTVPMERVQRIVLGVDQTVSQNFHGIGWPGYLKGQIRLKGLGLLTVHSTEPLERQLIVVTDTSCYGISPRDSQQFLEDFRARFALGSMRSVTLGEERAPLASLPFWRDRWLWGVLVVALVVNIALFGLIFARWNALPDRIALHFDAQGFIDRIDSKNGLLVIPVIGSLAWVIDSFLGFVLHQRERLGSYLLALSALSLQGVLWAATLGILGLG